MKKKEYNKIMIRWWKIKIFLDDIRNIIKKDDDDVI